jgi:hypothetical protein
MTSPRGISIPGWFLSVVVLAGSIVGVGYSIGGQVEKISRDISDQNKAVSTRLCRIEYWVGAPPNKACDVSDFLILGDDARFVPKPRPRP